MKRGLWMVTLVALFAAACPVAAAERVDADSAWSEARRLADEHRYDEALAVVRSALAEHPGHAGLLWLEAGVTAWSGRPADAVPLYESWQRRFPERASEVAMDLARARLDAGDVRGALADAERRLASAPLDRDARRLRAVALAYADRLDEAAEVYRGLLAADPHDVEARIGLARVRNWQGRHREAAERFRALLADGVQDPEVYRGLAYAERWAGRTRRAREPLRALLTHDASDRDARRLVREIAIEEQPHAAADFAMARDSDDLEVRTWSGEYRHPVGDRDAVSLHLREDAVEDPLGRYDMTRLGVGHERQWSDLVATHAYTYVEVDGPLTSDDVWLGDGWVTLRPSDGLRFDAGVGREPVLTRQALDLGLTMTTLGASVDWDFSDRWSLHGMHRRSFYADGNDLWRTDAGVRHRALALSGWRVYTGARFSHLGSQLDFDNGYYDPRAYVELGPELEVTWEPAFRWSAGVATRYGYQKETGGEGGDFIAIEGRLEAPLGRAFAAVLEAAHSDSRLASEGGYGRDAWSVGIRAHF